MPGSFFLGTSVVASVVAGSIALFAPCCISVMLPAYFATAFPNRRMLTAMTFLFAAGVGTVILPIALGASALRQVMVGGHTIIYVVGGSFMLGLAAYTLLGGQIHLPTPGRRAGRKAGPLGVYTLGVFSGVASSCCAPVLAGVIALSGLASSFGVALGLGTAYVFGMVAPLFVISVLWERHDWASSRLFRPRSFAWRLGPLRRTISGTGLASGLLLGLVGGAAVWIGLTGAAMPAPSGWQESLSVRLQHYGKALTQALSWVPGWAAILLLAGALVLLGRRALVGLRREDATDDIPTKPLECKEGIVEPQDA